MPVESSRSAKNIFLAAIEIQSPAAREAHLTEACRGDESLRKRVLALIAAHEAQNSLLNGEAPRLEKHADARSTAEFAVIEQPGTQIGPYKLRERLGTGGMGIVWAADQKKPLRRKVALKVIKPGMDSEQVLARFEAEREALGLMDHQNIARVLDAGMTSQGRPFFVMELVRGVPITDYCDANELTVRQRLELFGQACKAVQHAHQKGIIHRDIKPSNVLVSEQDGEPVVKVIDFGVAKALHRSLTDHSVYTGVFQAIGTLAYMSPEQAGLSVSDIDTRADVYSLGVLLYELLTGVTPFDKDKLASAALDEACRIIREQDPPRPSTRVSECTKRDATTMRTRTTALGLFRLLRGDLDSVVMTAMEKDRGRRYASVSALSEDIARFLGNRPVEAHSPGALYRFTKLVRRNKTTAGVVISAVFGLISIAITSSAMWVMVANKERLVRSQRYSSDVSRALELWSEGATEGARRLLERNEPELRDLTWQCVWNLCEQNRNIPSMQFNSRILAVATCPQADLVAISLSGGEVVLINLRERMVSERLPICVQDWLTAPIALSRDGSLLAYPGLDEQSYRIRKLTNDPPTEMRFEFGEPVRSAVFLDSLKSLAISHGQRVEIRNVIDGQISHELDLHADVGALAASPECNFIAMELRGNEIHIWDLRDANQACAVFEHDGTINNLVFSDDGAMLASSSRDKTVRVWRISSREQEHQFAATRDEVKGMVFSSANDKLLGGTFSGIVYCWELSSRRKVSTVRTHADSRLLAAACPGTLIACGGRILQFWPERLLRHSPIMRRKRQVREVKFLGEDHVLFFEIGSQAVQLVDLKTFDERTLLSLARESILSMAISPKQDLVAIGTRSGQIRLFDKTATEIKRCSTGGGVEALAFSNDGRYLGCAGMRGAFIWNVDSPNPRKLGESKMRSVAMTDNVVAFGAFQGNIDIYDLRTEELRRIAAHDEDVLCLSIAPGGDVLASGSFDGTVKIWVLGVERSQPRTIKDTGAWGIEFTKDGKYLLTCGGNDRVNLWDVHTLEHRFSFPKMHGYGKDVSFSPSGNGLVASTFSGDIRFWDLSP